jgi:hypothetical protein
MAGRRFDSSLTRVQPFFGALIARDPSGETWLGALLRATPHADLLGDLVEAPGTLDPSLTEPAKGGRMRCFEFPAAPPEPLLRWYIEHPEHLKWPRGAKFSEEATRWRRQLVCNDPPGARSGAQAEALRLLASPKGRSAWWRFEGTTMLDCVLMTDRLVVTVEGKRTEPISAATDWYPKRSQIVRNLEAARTLAAGRRWTSVVLSQKLIDAAGRQAVESSLPDAAPHLDDAERAELLDAYLGNLTWDAACAAVDLDPMD